VDIPIEGRAAITFARLVLLLNIPNNVDLSALQRLPRCGKIRGIYAEYRFPYFEHRTSFYPRQGSSRFVIKLSSQLFSFSQSSFGHL
jgi:hypothetical protein